MADLYHHCPGGKPGDGLSTRQRREQRAARGVCIACGGSRDAEGATCERCLERTRSVRRYRVANGLCRYCARPLVNTKIQGCLECRRKRAEYRKQLTATKKAT